MFDCVTHAWLTQFAQKDVLRLDVEVHDVGVVQERKSAQNTAHPMLRRVHVAEAKPDVLFDIATWMQELTVSVKRSSCFESGLFTICVYEEVTGRVEQNNLHRHK